MKTITKIIVDHCTDLFFCRRVKIITKLVFFLLSLSLRLSAQTTVSTMQGTYTNGEYINVSSIDILPNTTITPGNGQNVYIHITAFSCNPLGLTPSSGQNYIITSVPRIAGYDPSNVSYSTCQLMQTVQYLDGLGRALQTVQVKGSADAGHDLVQPVSYDAYGREAVKYLPYTATTADGSYKADALISGQANFYNAPSPGVTQVNFPYAQTKFENLMQPRPLEQGAPGNDWQPASTPGTSATAGHTVKITYDINADSEVALWLPTGNGANGSNFYASGQLAKTITVDENGNQTLEYKDNQGRIVCKKVQSGPSSYYTTSYVYNDIGQLTYVIPQITGGIPASFLETDAVFANFIYGYHYDNRNRLTEKKIPGKGWQYMAYNAADQIVATQDAVQLATHRWTFIKYDVSGRVIMTGDITDTRNHQVITDAIASQTQAWETTDASTVGYTNISFPTAAPNVVYTINYYDDYSFPGGNTYTPTASNVGTIAQGMLTGSKTNVLGSATMLLTEMYYDDKGRLRESIAQNHAGGYDRIVNDYNFNDQVTQTTRTHSSSTVSSLLIANTYTYDHMGHKVQSTEQINNGPQATIAKTDYNDVGQLTAKHLGNNLQTVSYTYNERGWLLSSSAPLFAMQLQYNNNSLNVPGFAALYNGIIASQNWGTPGNLPNYYAYAYDNLNRLTSGNSNTGNNENNITYDALGNIIGLTRMGMVSQNLSYSYNGNQATAVTNSSAPFRSYGYDDNGNATSDGQGHGITYNYLNLTSTVAALNLSYTYDAGGNKLKKVSGSVTTDYIGGIQYTNGTIDFIQTEEGRAINSNGSYIYEYTLTDHLGNARVSFDQNSATTAKQQDYYYPFGMVIEASSSSPPNKYLYNGKELQDQLGQFDYGARFYDPVIARWATIDPLAEKSTRWSPYNYVQNSPVNRVDPDGMTDYGYGQTSCETCFVDHYSFGDDQEETVSIDLTSKDNSAKKSSEGHQNSNSSTQPPSNSGGGVIINGHPIYVPGMKSYISITFNGKFDITKLAISVSTGVSGTFQIQGGASVHGNLEEVMFFNSEYGYYIYSYVSTGASGRLGLSEHVSGDVGLSVSIGYNLRGNFDPSTWAGRTDFTGVDAAFHAELGGGLSAQYFHNNDWKGISIGGTVGIGVGLNAGSVFKGSSYGWQITPTIPTARRSVLDRVINASKLMTPLLLP